MNVLSKFAGFTSDMEQVVLNFNNSGKKVTQLITDLKVDSKKFLPDDEIFLVKVKQNNGATFNPQYSIPTGNEGGALVQYFKPGGILPRFKNLAPPPDYFYPREAVITNASQVVHNKDWNTFITFFGNSNVTKIYP